MNRRSAIVAISAMFAAFGGKRVYPQRKKPEEGLVLNNIGPAWFQLSVVDGGGFRFLYKGETVEIKAEELWAALKQ